MLVRSAGDEPAMLVHVTLAVLEIVPLAMGAEVVALNIIVSMPPTGNVPTVIRSVVPLLTSFTLTNPAEGVMACTVTPVKGGAGSAS